MALISDRETGQPTLVQAIDEGFAGHFCLRAGMIQNLPTPLQRRVGALLSRLLFRGHIQPRRRKRESESERERDRESKIIGYSIVKT